MKNYTNFRLFMLLFVIFSFLNEDKLFSQNLPILTNERGDTISYTWPIPDSLLCVKDEIIIKFRPQTLNLTMLCYYVPGPPLLDSTNIDPLDYFRSYLYSQQFSIDSLILDINLRNVLKNIGGLYLSRIHLDNPCTDTLSITRFGDTLRISNYLWMLLKLDNDTTLISSSTYLSCFFRNQIESAEPNFCIGNFNAIPIKDTHYNYQFSLMSNESNAQRAWDFQTGSEEIKIGVIDTGINDIACELGRNIYGPNYRHKVKDGFNFFSMNNNYNLNSTHGTSVSSIIAGYTNGTARFENCDCSTSGETGIAGIAGGWYDLVQNIDNEGCSLYALKINVDSGTEEEEEAKLTHVIDAIKSASTKSTVKGVTKDFGVDIINCSWGFKFYHPALEDAINYAFEHGVSIICSRGNEEDNDEDPKHSWYPACYNPSWITNVSGHDNGQDFGSVIKHDGLTYYGYGIDLVAPSSKYSICSVVGYDNENSEDIIDDHLYMGKTSAAAAHVSGAIALLRSEFYEHPNLCNGKPEPEDYENMLKAAAKDLNYDPDGIFEEEPTNEGYDNATGWGQLKIGEIFEMLDEGYKLFHFTIDNNDLDEDKDGYPDFINTPFSSVKELTTIPKNYGFYKSFNEGDYYTTVREISHTFSLPNDWEINENTPLYIWGRNGRSSKGGFSQANPRLFLTCYTQITSGEGGNNLADGIYQNSDLEVTVRTFQYEIYENENSQDPLQNLPLNDNIALHYSVFGKPKPVSVKDKYLKENDFTVVPNPVINSLTLNYKIDQLTEPQIIIYNTFGQIIDKINLDTHNPGNYSRKITLNNLTPGVYFIKLDKKYQCNIIKFIVVK